MVTISNSKYFFLVFLSDIQCSKIIFNDCSSQNAKKTTEKVESLGRFQGFTVCSQEICKL